VVLLTPFLKKTRYNVAKEVIFLPMSGYTAANMRDPVSKQACPWYDGPTLLGALDQIPPLERKAVGPLRIPVIGSYKERGLVTIMGKVESGTVSVGQPILLMPGATKLEVVSLTNDTHSLRSGRPGENVMVSVKGTDDENIEAGTVLCDAANPITVSDRFEVLMVLMELKEKSLVTAGFEAMLHLHTASEEMQVLELLAEVDLATQKEIKKRPMFAKSGSAIRCRIQTAHPVCLEPFKDQPQLGRFTLREGVRTIAFGKVLVIGEKKKK